MLSFLPSVAVALAEKAPVVALETTLLAHGLPWPSNYETALAAEAAIRATGAVPACCGVLHGQAKVGLTEAELEYFARTPGIRKASSRDLASALAFGESAATTVSATMRLAHRAGISVFATGGIGGAHRGEVHAWDLSSDLTELARTPTVVVCAGAKSILDLPKTLELLETLSVPVLGWQSDTFAAFYLHSSGEKVSQRVDTLDQVSQLVHKHWAWGGAGIVLAQPLPVADALEPTLYAAALQEAERRASQAGLKGQAVTPRLLAWLAELTQGQSLLANRTLLINNARLAGELACRLARGADLV